MLYCSFNDTEVLNIIQIIYEQEQEKKINLSELLAEYNKHIKNKDKEIFQTYIIKNIQNSIQFYKKNNINFEKNIIIYLIIINIISTILFFIYIKDENNWKILLSLFFIYSLIIISSIMYINYKYINNNIFTNSLCLGIIIATHIILMIKILLQERNIKQLILLLINILLLILCLSTISELLIGAILLYILSFFIFLYISEIQNNLDI
jgi:hypothetical protein